MDFSFYKIASVGALVVWSTSGAMAEDKSVEELFSEAEEAVGGDDEEEASNRPSLVGSGLPDPVVQTAPQCELSLSKMRENAKYLKEAPKPLYGQLSKLSEELDAIEEKIPLGSAGDCSYRDTRSIEHLTEHLEEMDTHNPINRSTRMIGCVAHWENVLKEKEREFFADPDSVDTAQTSRLSTQAAVVDELNTITLQADKELNWIQNKKRRMLTAVETIKARCIIDLDY
jgi:hypothetical protein